MPFYSTESKTRAEFCASATTQTMAMAARETHEQRRATTSELPPASEDAPTEAMADS